MSDVAGYIDQIETGGGSTPFTYIDYIEYKGVQYKENFSGTVAATGDSLDTSEITIKIKTGEYRCVLCSAPDIITINPEISGNMLLENQTYTLTTSFDKLKSLDGLAIMLIKGSVYNYQVPDAFFLEYAYQGE